MPSTFSGRSLWIGMPQGLARLGIEDALASAIDDPVRILSNNALRFVFAAPRYGAPERTRYRTRLDGFHRAAPGRAASGAGWSDWSDETDKDYTNL